MSTTTTATGSSDKQQDSINQHPPNKNVNPFHLHISIMVEDGETKSVCNKLMDAIAGVFDDQFQKPLALLPKVDLKFAVKTTSESNEVAPEDVVHLQAAINHNTVYACSLDYLMSHRLSLGTPQDEKNASDANKKTQDVQQIC